MYAKLCDLILALAIWSVAFRVSSFGVNWGTVASHPLSPSVVVTLLKSNNISKVKLFDADPLVLQALSGSNIVVTVGIPNFMLRSLNSSMKAAKSWVHDNVTRYSSNAGNGVHIKYIAVGDEPFLLNYGDQYHPFVIGAAINIHTALVASNLDRSVKVVVPCGYDAIHSASGLPSKARFRPDINQTMGQLLPFLATHASPFVVTISPFRAFLENKNTSLDFALFKKPARHLPPAHKTYGNSFESSYDSVVAALSAAGFSQMEIVVGKIGWPTDGIPDATSSNAEAFMKGLIRHVAKFGTPLRPRGPPPEIYVYSLLDEDGRSIVNGDFERHWGVFSFDGQSKYPLDGSLVNARNVRYLAPLWCVANNDLDLSNASAAASDACARADCTSLSRGGSCFNMSWPGNVSYAFNSYYQANDEREGSCDFEGLGMITKVDPSLGGCRFSVQLQASNSVPLGMSLLVWALWFLY